jgi:alpha-ribazole phosphatase
VDPALAEMDFGAWDGRPWGDISPAAFDAWCADFLRHAPGGGETLEALLARVRRFNPGPARALVTHGGWLSAAAWWARPPGQPLQPADWPAPPAHARLTRLAWPPGPG